MSSLRVNSIVVLLALSCGMYAQQDLMQYINQSTPQSMFQNPAFAPDVNAHVGLPFLSGVSAHHTNFIFSPTDLFEKEGSATRFRKNHYLSLIKDRNSAGVEMSVNALMFGFRLWENYFNFSVRERVHFAMDIPGDMLRLPVLGNVDPVFENGVIDFSDFSLDLTHYAEYGLGWQGKLSEKTALGARMKLLFGRENVRTTRSDVQWIVDPVTYEYTFQGGLEFNTSGVAYLLDSIDANGYLENGEVTRYLFQFRNAGVGFDLGFDHEINEKLRLTGSVTDLGFINWGNSTRNFRSSGNQMIFSGVEITEEIIASGDAFGDSLQSQIDAAIESLESTYELTEDREEAYRTPTNTRLYLGGEYTLLDNDNMKGTVGLLLHTAMYQGEWTPTVSLSYRHELGDWMTVSLAYSKMKEDWKNLGLALSLQGGPTQFYITMDNLFFMNMSSILTDPDDDSSGYPTFSTNSAIGFGFSYFFLKKDNTVKEAKY